MLVIYGLYFRNSNIRQPDIQQVQARTRWHFAFAAMLHVHWLLIHAALCCRRNETPCIDCKSAQQCTTRRHPYHSSKLHPGPCSSVGMRRGIDRHTHTHRHTGRRAGWPIKNVPNFCSLIFKCVIYIIRFLTRLTSSSGIQWRHWWCFWNLYIGNKTYWSTNTQKEHFLHKVYTPL